MPDGSACLQMILDVTSGLPDDLCRPSRGSARQSMSLTAELMRASRDSVTQPAGQELSRSLAEGPAPAQPRDRDDSATDPAPPVPATTHPWQFDDSFMTRLAAPKPTGHGSHGDWKDHHPDPRSSPAVQSAAATIRMPTAVVQNDASAPGPSTLASPRQSSRQSAGRVSAASAVCAPSERTSSIIALTAAAVVGQPRSVSRGRAGSDAQAQGLVGRGDVMSTLASASDAVSATIEAVQAGVLSDDLECALMDHVDEVMGLIPAYEAQAGGVSIDAQVRSTQFGGDTAALSACFCSGSHRHETALLRDEWSRCHHLDHRHAIAPSSLG